MNNYYDFGGMKVSSSFKLNGLRPVETSMGRKIRSVCFMIDHGALPDAAQPIFQWPGRYGMSLWSHEQDWLIKSSRTGSFLISDEGRQIRCFPGGGTVEDDMGEFIARRLLPRLSIFHGGLAVHGASLSDGMGGFVFLGASGSGKSTLTATLHHKRGWDVFSDDISILHLDPHVKISPASTGVCLWRDSLSGLGLRADATKKLSAYKNKFVIETGDDTILTPKPVCACVLLKSFNGIDSGAGNVRIERIPSHAAFFHLWRQLVRFNPSDHAMESFLCNNVGALASAIPMYTLSYPRGYEKLDEVLNGIETFARTLSGVNQ
ncbi:MAG: hypothetical protein KKD44_11600 [Proteobacteria bacterium]|nr:hypothetical protein [Pseudomonadota bacterium]